MDLTDLEALVKTWINYTERHPSIDGDTRAAGYQAGLLICADQLAGLIERMRADVSE